MLVELVLILLHGPDGREIRVSPHQITSMQSALDDSDNKVLHQSIRCSVGLTDGKRVNVVEPCPVVEQMMQHAKRSKP